VENQGNCDFLQLGNIERRNAIEADPRYVQFAGRKQEFPRQKIGVLRTLLHSLLSWLRDNRLTNHLQGIIKMPCTEGQPDSSGRDIRGGMPKLVEKWLLYKYVGLEFTPLSQPFKTREQAERAREKYPERERKAIGVGVVRLKR